LSAITDAAVVNNTQDDEEDDDGGEETPTFNNKQRLPPTYSSSSSSSNNTYQASPGQSYTYLWNNPVIRTNQTWVGIASILLLWFDFVVFMMWVFGFIPGLPSSSMYYGFIIYFLFILTGILTLFMSCNKRGVMHTITLIIVFVAFILSLFMNVLLWYNIKDCWTGVLDQSCSGFLPITILLFFVTIAIAVIVFTLLILFSMIVTRVSQSFSTIDSFY